ncbi:MAG: ammonium transporter [Akkermansiaceae bacterium]|nr:ammonium transporter [Akkermansiaceae bacterium]
MKAGFCCLETGLIRSKNAINTALNNALDTGTSVLGYLFLGFGLMFGPELIKGFLGFGNLPFGGYSGDHPVWIFFFFQVVFCAVTLTIAKGAMAERTSYLGYMIFTLIGGAVIYPILGHWVWGSFGTGFGFAGEKGWLEALGFKDFAGSTVIHAMGGAFALAGIMVVGPRVGRFNKDGSANTIPGHNMPLIALGSFILWFGWFAFNAGSNLAEGPIVGKIATNSLVSGCSGLLFTVLVYRLKNGWVDATASFNGALGGLVAITASSDLVHPVAAVFIGAISSLVTGLMPHLLAKFKLDDAVDAVSVHLGCGIFGTLCVSVFNPNAPFSNFGVQFLGAFSVSIGAFVASYAVFKVIDLTIGMKVAAEDQITGLDFADHSANAYPNFTIIENINEEER